MFAPAVVIQGPDVFANDQPAFQVKVRRARIASGTGGTIFMNQQGADLTLEKVQVVDVTASILVLIDNRFAEMEDTETNISETDVSESSIDVSGVCVCMYTIASCMHRRSPL